MWIRLRLDIDWSDLAAGALACGSAFDRKRLQSDSERFWSNDDDIVVCLSVRSGFDLLLQALDLPPGSEVLMSALTVPDMVQIVKQHGLVPVPVDLVPSGSAPCLDSLRRAVSPASRVMVLAHLFGSRIALEPFIRTARQNGLLLVEDCAQAFCGPHYLGHPDSDAAMFSFGPIKTATALGGAVLRVSDPQLALRMRQLQSHYPVQGRLAYFRRLLRYAALKVLTTRPVFGAVAKTSVALRFDLDVLLNNAARSFSQDQLLKQIRQQPSAPLLSLLLRRWRRYDIRRLHHRAKMGEWMLRQLGGELVSDDGCWERDSHWVFPVLAEDPEATIRHLHALGFDATRRMRLDIVPPAVGREEIEPTNALATVSDMVMLPWYPDLTSDAMRRMTQGLAAVRPLVIDCQTGADVDNRLHPARRAETIRQ